MLGYFLLPILGLALLWGLVEDDDDPETETPTPPETDDPFTGTAAGETINGTGTGNLIDGRGGDDILRGFGGNDTIFGGDGEDLLTGEGGDDQLRGEADDDVLRGGPGADNLVGGAGNDFLEGGKGNDEIRGWRGNDELLGGQGADLLVGNQGDDRIVTGFGGDTAFGGEGDDVIFGYQSPIEGGRVGDLNPDSLNGGNGNDIISANYLDTVTSGDGNDVIDVVFDAGQTDSPVTITDFDAEEDILVIVIGNEIPFDGDEDDGDAVDPDEVVVRASESGEDTEVLLNGVLAAVLQNTNAAALDASKSEWLANFVSPPPTESATT